MVNESLDLVQAAQDCIATGWLTDSSAALEVVAVSDHLSNSIACRALHMLIA